MFSLAPMSDMRIGLTLYITLPQAKPVVTYSSGTGELCGWSARHDMGKADNVVLTPASAKEVCGS